MKIIVTILVVILLALMGIAGYLYYKLSGSEVYVAPTAPTSKVIPASGTEPSEQSDVSVDAVESPSAAIPAAGFTIDVATLPESQQAVLHTLGFEETVTFTEEMVTCAEEKLGVARVAEIIDGATPSVIESTKLVPCL
jgi:flagellar basal body-associated protein FliL